MSDETANIGSDSVKGPDVVVDVKVSDKSIEEAKRKFEELHGDMEDDVHIESLTVGGNATPSGGGGDEIKLEGLDEVNANLSIIRDSLDRIVEMQSEMLAAMLRMEEERNG